MRRINDGRLKIEELKTVFGGFLPLLAAVVAVMVAPKKSLTTTEKSTMNGAEIWVNICGKLIIRMTQTSEASRRLERKNK